MYVFMNSFMTGVNDLQSDLVFTTISHIRIYNDVPRQKENILKKTFQETKAIHIRNEKQILYEEGIKNANEITDFLEKQPEVVATTPQVNVSVSFRSGSNNINGILSGVEAEGEDRLFNMTNHMREGKWSQLKYQANGLIIGNVMAEEMNLKVGDNLTVLTFDGVSRNYTIIGIFQTYTKTIDRTKAYLNIASVRQLISKNRGYATDIQVNIKNFDATSLFSDKLTALLPFQVEKWQTANEQLDAANTIREILALAVSLTILIVAGFGIYNIMNMTVNEKIKEIAILKAMGFGGNDIVQIFLLQAIAIGFIGGLTGLLLGFGLANIIDQIPFKLASFDTLPMAYRAKDYLQGFAFGMLITGFAGYLPARKASKVDPVSIIRG
ncbi:MAG: ABC transporter permease [Microscillaceae bacterium]